MVWLSYGAGVVLTSLTKVWQYKQTQSLTWKWALLWFFFEGRAGKASATSVTTWTMIGAYLVLGAWYSGELALHDEPQTWLPVHWTVAFLLGTVSELVAPPIVKWVVQRVSGAFRTS